VLEEGRDKPTLAMEIQIMKMRIVQIQDSSTLSSSLHSAIIITTMLEASIIMEASTVETVALIITVLIIIMEDSTVGIVASIIMVLTIIMGDSTVGTVVSTITASITIMEILDLVVAVLDLDAIVSAPPLQPSNLPPME